MNVHTLKALAWDAIYQVLDNSVFRILAALTAIPILTVFLIGFREDRIELLFGLESWSYENVLGVAAALQGLSPTDVVDPQGVTIQALITLVFDSLMGTFGVLFCIAATAFFVPRMLEKGSADLLFHKPVSRGAFYLARYGAGLLFIGLLGLLLVAGIYTGLLIVSRYNDPGIFFAALQLTYVFGLIYSVCMLIGVVTRSTVAAILLSSLFFVFNGCVHQGWIQLEQARETERLSEEQAAAAKEAQAVLRGEEDSATAPVELEAGSEEDSDTLVRVLVRLLETAHYVLPKTYDAPLLAQRLRARFDRFVLRDPESLVCVYRVPAGAEVLSIDGLDPALVDPGIDPAPGELRLALRFSEPDAHAFLFERPITEETVEVRGRTRTRRETPARVASRIASALEEQENVDQVERKTLAFGGNSRGSPSYGAVRLTWREKTPAGTPSERLLVFFRGADAQSLWTLYVRSEVEAGPDPVLEGFLHSIDRTLALDRGNDRTWYAKQAGWNAPLRFNYFFSIASSLAFAALTLALGWWRLTRIEF